MDQEKIDNALSMLNSYRTELEDLKTCSIGKTGDTREVFRRDINTMKVSITAMETILNTLGIDCE